MSIAEVISLSLIMVTLAFMPSSSVALVVARSLTHGVLNGVSVSLGIVLGDLIFIFLAIIGLSVVAEAMGWLFLAIRYIGAVYLIWLGYRLLTSKRMTTITLDKANQKENLITSFLAGLFFTLSDIKAIFFYVSLFPVFVNLEEIHLADVAMIMLVTIVTVGGVKIFYAFSAGKILLMSKQYNFENKVKKAAGGLLVGAGGFLIVKA